jgi:hypothetical protein
MDDDSCRKIHWVPAQEPPWPGGEWPEYTRCDASHPKESTAP